MKKIFSFIIIILFLSTENFSQESKYFDAPFGGGGGFTPGFIFPNLDPLNNILPTDFPKLSNKTIFTTGGSGFIYIGLIKFLRVGGGGFSGSTSEMVQSPVDNYRREIRYSIGGGGFTIEYTIPFVRTFGISVGTMIGGGSINAQIYKNQGKFFWNDLTGNFGNPSAQSDNISRTISGSYWLISPSLNIDIPIYRFVAIRVGAGYQFSLGESWTIDNDQSLNDVPSAFNGRSFFIQTGVFLGFFAF
jgi:hypothetical protein